MVPVRTSIPGRGTSARDRDFRRRGADSSHLGSSEKRFSMNPSGLRAWAADIRAKADREAKALEDMARELEEEAKA